VLKFYLQIFTGFQRGFHVSRGRCPTCKRFLPKIRIYARNRCRYQFP